MKQEEYVKMDYSLESAEARLEKVNEILSTTPSENLSSYYLEKMADYLIFTQDYKKENKKEKSIDTTNHNVTIKKREMSFEGLIGKLENGEDGIYNMIANDKNIIFSPKIGITPEDIETIPGMRELVDAINKLESSLAGVRGHKALIMHQQLIAMRQDQYVLKSMFTKPIHFTNIKKTHSQLDLTENITIDENENVHSTGFINLYTPEHISLLLCNYSRIKEEAWDKFNSDIKWIMEDLDGLIERNIKDQFPLYYDLIIYKIDGKSNAEIQTLLSAKHDIKHSVEYLSALWRNKIPKLLADAAIKEFLVWHYTFEERGKWKKCSKCGQIKLASNWFFSKNNTSKDGYYSICKECRNSKSKKILPR